MAGQASERRTTRVITRPEPTDSLCSSVSVSPASRAFGFRTGELLFRQSDEAHFAIRPSFLEQFFPFVPRIRRIKIPISERGSRTEKAQKEEDEEEEEEEKWTSP